MSRRIKPGKKHLRKSLKMIILSHKGQVAAENEKAIKPRMTKYD
jgi:hypothetical protein